MQIGHLVPTLERAGERLEGDRSKLHRGLKWVDTDGASPISLYHPGLLHILPAAGTPLPAFFGELYSDQREPLCLIGYGLHPQQPIANR